MAQNLMAMAKEHFGYMKTAPDCNIPKSYLAELDAHLKQYVWDSKFTIKRQPRVGFGVLTCQEEGCSESEIALTSLQNVRDGGKRAGVGSLSPYRDHIEKHPTHKRAVQKRVKATHGEAQNGVSMALMNLNARGINAVASSHSLAVAVQGNDTRRASARYTSDMDTPVVPLKRHSDTAFVDSSSGIWVKDEEPDSPPAMKKARYEDAQPRSPLATNRMTLNTAPGLIAPTPSVDVDELREKHRDILARISHLEPIYDRAVRKTTKSKGEETRIATYRHRLLQLKQERDDLKAQIAMITARPVYRSEPVVAGLPVVVRQEPHRNLAVEAGPSTRHPQATGAPMVLAAQPAKPILLPWEAHVQRHQDQNPAPALPAEQRLQLAKHQRFGGQLPVAAPFPMKIEPTYNPVNPPIKQERVNTAASGSGLNRASASNTIVKPEPKAVVPVKTEVAEQRIAPIASSSRTHQEASSFELKHTPVSDALPELKFEDSDSEDSDSDGGYGQYYSGQFDEIGERLARRLLDDAGIVIPPPIRDSRDEDGLFFGRGRDLYEGPRAHHNDINQFIKLAGNEETFDNNASVVESLAKLGLKDLEDTIPGMDIALMPHQVIGVSWMVEREASVIKGGCLADDMGLGKTVQMMALMVKNRSKDPKNKLNLILAPLALLDQWKYEIETKTNCDLKVLIYHGHTRPRKARDLREYDITMALEWPDYENEAKKKAKAKRQKKREGSFIVDDPDDEALETKVSRRKESCGLLFQMDFYRIILDESQNIRNRLTRTSRAASELSGTYRWCLTGTPIINGLSDAYGGIRFLKIRPWYDWSDFHKHISRNEKKNPALAVSRLQAILKTFQLRRTKDSMLDGKKLIELPEKKIEVTALNFTQEEADIYKMVEARSQATFNRYLRAGTVLKNYHQVLVLLLRLRQICSHPCLIQEDVAAFVSADEDVSLKAQVASEVSRAGRVMSLEWVIEVKKRLKDRMLARIEAEKESPDAALEGEDCPICLDVMNETCVLTACKHAFCKECIVDVLSNPSVEMEGDAAKNKDQRPCPVCRAPVDQKLLFTRAAFEPTDRELNPHAIGEDSEDEISDSDMDVDEVPASRKGKGRAAKRSRGAYKGMDDEDDDEDDDDDMSDFIVEDGEDEDDKDFRRDEKQRARALGKRRANVILDSDEEDEAGTAEIQSVLFGAKTKAQLEAEALEKMPRFLPSTKMKYMMQLIVKKFKENPEEKILVISQWTACLSLVSDYLSEKGIGHVKYQGDMNRDKRDAAVRVFMSKQKAKVMLMSLKCGGVGLNLTRANNVISLDLAWARAIESQAWDRVHRLGQKLPVKVDRLVIADTVEDRIMTLQERKQALADGSLGEGKGKKIGKLTVKELANLFGLDDRGRLL